jgi:hypothetical protein
MSEIKISQQQNVRFQESVRLLNLDTFDKFPLFRRFRKIYETWLLAVCPNRTKTRLQIEGFSPI